MSDVRAAPSPCRRLVERLGSDALIEALYPTYGFGHLVNESPSGMRLWLPFEVEPGSLICFVVRQRDERLTVRARVVWCARTLSGYASGVACLDAPRSADDTFNAAGAAACTTAPLQERNDDDPDRMAERSDPRA